MKFSCSLFAVMTLFSNGVFAQTDTTLRYDKWIGWVTPASGLHVLHPAIEVGAEYSQGNQWAYMLNYGIRIMNRRDQHFDDQSHQYIRLGFKRYFAPRFNSGYIMPELGLFHLAHKGRHGNITWQQSNRPDLQADARIHDFYLKAGALIGRKMKAGGLRFDIFMGGGARFTFRHHTVLKIMEYDENRVGHAEHGWGMPYDHIYIRTPKGWRSHPPLYYLSLGIRFGIGLKPMRIPAENNP